jgi:hypothetical protein
MEAHDASPCGCRAVALGLADRLAACSEVLGQLAQRDGRVAEILRLRAALEAVLAARGEGRVDEAVKLAKGGLRW